MEGLFLSSPHRRFRPAADETVPHPSDVCCPMGGRSRNSPRPFILLDLQFCFSLEMSWSLRVSLQKTLAEIRNLERPSIPQTTSIYRGSKYPRPITRVVICAALVLMSAIPLQISLPACAYSTISQPRSQVVW